MPTPRSHRSDPHPRNGARYRAHAGRAVDLPDLPGTMDGCGRVRPHPPTAPLENVARHAMRDARRFPQLLGNPGKKPPGFPQLHNPGGDEMQYSSVSEGEDDRNGRSRTPQHKKVTTRRFAPHPVHLRPESLSTFVGIRSMWPLGSRSSRSLPRPSRRRVASAGPARRSTTRSTASSRANTSIASFAMSPHAGVPAPRRMKMGVGGGRETDQAWSLEPGYEFG